MQRVRSAPVTPRRLSRPLVRFDPAFVSYWEFFEAVAPGVHRRGRDVARRHVLDLRFATGGVDASVRSASTGADGGPVVYPVQLMWSTAVPVPGRIRPWCGCPYRRRWCKHAIAVAYHVADRR
jgi:uncharacterized Zn finger protein